MAMRSTKGREELKEVAREAPVDIPSISTEKTKQRVSLLFVIHRINTPICYLVKSEFFELTTTTGKTIGDLLTEKNGDSDSCEVRRAVLTLLCYGRSDVCYDKNILNATSFIMGCNLEILHNGAIMPKDPERIYIVISE